MKKTFFLAGALAAATGTWAADQKETLKPRDGGGKNAPIEVKRDPQQTALDPTTQIKPNTPAGAPAATEKGAAPQANSIDKDMQNRVLVALSTGSLGTQGVIATNQLTNIKVEVKDRVVTLRGDVTSEKNRQTIEKRVKGLDGVTRVVNELKVNPSAKTKRPDLQHPDGYAPSGNQSPSAPPTPR